MRKGRGKNRFVRFAKKGIVENKDFIYGFSGGIARILLSAIPEGALVSQMWSEIDNLLAIASKKKIEAFARSLKEELDAHKSKIELRIKNIERTQEEMLKRAAAETRIIDCLAKEFEAPKVELLALVTVNCIIEDNLVWDKKIRAIDSFRQITMKDIAVLKQFSENSTLQVKSITGDSLEGLVPSLCKLSSLGLISEMMNKDSGPWTDSVESDWKITWPNKYYEILPSGQDLLKIIAE